MSKNFQEIPFTNRFGQIINVGDTVIAIASGYGRSIKFRPATYLGQTGSSPTVEFTHCSYQLNAMGTRYENTPKKKRSTLPSGRIFPSTFSDNVLNDMYR